MNRFNNSLVVFFLIAFGGPWIGWSLIHLLGEGLPSQARLLLFYTGNFCSVAGFAAVYVDGGKEGVRELWRRCILVKAPPFWWAFVFLVPFLVTLGAIQVWALSGNETQMTNAWAIFLLFTPPLMRNLTTGPLGEEAGWRGYLLPKMMERYSPLVASLIIGVIWGLWHIPLYIDSVFASLSLAFLFTSGTVSYTIIMTVIFNHTKQSVFVAVIFHWFVNMLPAAILLMFDGPTGDDLIVQTAAGYAFVALGLVILTGKKLEFRRTQDG